MKNLNYVLMIAAAHLIAHSGFASEIVNKQDPSEKLEFSCETFNELENRCAWNIVTYWKNNTAIKSDSYTSAPEGTLSKHVKVFKFTSEVGGYFLVSGGLVAAAGTAAGVGSGVMEEGINPEIPQSKQIIRGSLIAGAAIAAIPPVADLLTYPVRVAVNLVKIIKLNHISKDTQLDILRAANDEKAPPVYLEKRDFKTIRKALFVGLK